MSERRRTGFARWLGVLRLSRRQLQHRWLESVLIVLGIALGVGVLVAGETFVRFQLRMDTEFLAGYVRQWEAVGVWPNVGSSTSEFYGSDAVPAIRISDQDVEEPVRFTLADLSAMRAEVPGVRHVTIQGGGTIGQIVAVDDAELDFDVDLSGLPSDVFVSDMPSLRLELVTPDEFAAAGYEFSAGASFTWDDFGAGERRLVLERTSMEQLFPGVNPADAIGRTVTTRGFAAGGEGNRWVIIGIIDIPEEIRLMMGTGSASGNQILGYAPATIESSDWGATNLFLSPEDESFIPQITEAAQVYFDQKYGAGRVELRNPLAESESGLDGAAPVVTALLLLAGLGLIIAAVNVLNLFTARVLRRMRITGMSVALGATRRLLFWQTAGEALLLGTSGSVIGIGIAGGFVAVIRTFLSEQMGAQMLGINPFSQFKLGLPDVAVGMIAGVGLSLIFGLYPAWIGSRQDPVEALRVE